MALSAPRQAAAAAPSSDAGSTELPRRFGPYLLLRALLRGGMGQVYLARSGALAGAERLCVLKTIRPDIASDDEYVRRFVDEARIAVTLNHASVCHVFDAGRVGDTLYLAMEHIAGLNLSALLEQLGSHGRALPPSHALFIAVELLEALDYAHHHRHPETGEALHIVHRDVSPHNVMVSFEGEVKLIDFGLARSRSSAVTTSSGVMGKLLYMSPEQARGDRLDGATDQYSAAVVAYEILSGTRFWGARTRDQVFEVVGHGTFVPDDIDTLAPEIQRVLLRAWRARPEERYASCGEMATELRMILARHHPMMSRTALRQFLHEALADLIDAHRLALRALPSVPTGATELQTEPTQSFTLRMPASPTSSPTLQVTELVAERERPRAAVRAPRHLVMRSVIVATVAATAIGVAAWMRVATSDAREGVPSDAPHLTEAAPPTLPPEQPASPEGVDVNGAADVVGAAVDARAVPNGADGEGTAIAPEKPAADPHRLRAAPRKARERSAEKSKSAAADPGVPGAAAPPEAVVSPPQAEPRARVPGSVETKRKAVLACAGVCHGIRKQIEAGKDVSEDVLDRCLHQCRGDP